MKTIRRTGQTLLIAGVIVCSVAGAAWGHDKVQPTLSPTVATFTIPAGSDAVWTLTLWECVPGPTCKSDLIGMAEGSVGELSLTVPHTAQCAFQVDVREGATLYDGLRERLASCGTAVVTTTTTTTTMPTKTKKPPAPPTPKPGFRHASPAPTTPSAPLAFTGPGAGLYVLGALGVLLMTLGGFCWRYGRRYAGLRGEALAFMSEFVGDAT